MAWVISLGFLFFDGGVGLKKKIPLWVLIRER